MPQLVLPDVKYKDSFLSALDEYRQDALTVKLGMYTDIDLPSIKENFAQFVSHLRQEAQGIDLPTGYVPHTTYWLVEGNQFLGRADIRHQLNDSLKLNGGHIGYDVRPSQRNKGYGSLLLKLAIEKAHQLGIKEVLVTCNIDNVGSNKVIQKNGGVLESTYQLADKTTKNRYWIKMHLKFLTLNLFEGGLFFDGIIAFLKKENPDIFVIQEVNNGTVKNLPAHFRSLQVLSENFPAYQSFFSPEMALKYPEGEIDIGNAIFSKFPILQTATIILNSPYGKYDPVPIGGDFSQHPKNMQWSEIQVGLEKINVFNLHGLWELSGNDTPERLKMSEIIVDAIKNKNKVILAGDFNLKPHTQTIKKIEMHLNNVFQDELSTTFNLKQKDLHKFPGYADAVVDMIFVSRDIQVLSKNCPQVDISDHLSLICELEI